MFSEFPTKNLQPYYLLCLADASVRVESAFAFTHDTTTV